MGRKNIARSVIEGGRSIYYKSMRDAANRRDRHAWTELERGLRGDPEWADDVAGLHGVSMIGVYGGERFSDKLQPIYRWMKSRSGRLWDDVYSELCRRFDRRGLDGNHIIYDHVLPHVANNGINDPVSRYFYRYFDYWVDEDGMFWYRSYRDMRRAERAEMLLEGLRKKLVDVRNGVGG